MGRDHTAGRRGEIYRRPRARSRCASCSPGASRAALTRPPAWVAMTPAARPSTYVPCDPSDVGSASRTTISAAAFEQMRANGIFIGLPFPAYDDNFFASEVCVEVGIGYAMEPSASVPPGAAGRRLCSRRRWARSLLRLVEARMLARRLRQRRSLRQRRRARTGRRRRRAGAAMDLSLREARDRARDPRWTARATPGSSS